MTRHLKGGRSRYLQSVRTFQCELPWGVGAEGVRVVAIAMVTVEEEEVAVAASVAAPVTEVADAEVDITSKKTNKQTSL